MFLVRNSLRNLSQILVQVPKVHNNNAQRHISRWVSPTLRELKRRREKIGPEKLEPRSSYLEWNYEAEIFAFGKRLREDFDKDLLKKAFVHKSFAYWKKENESIDLDDNEDLIKEGNGIIQKYVEEFFNGYSRDVKNSLMNYLTSEDMLAHVGKHIGLIDLILTPEFPVDKSTVSNTFKAVIAALKHSTSLEQSNNFLKDFLIVQLNGKAVFDIWEPKDPVDYLNNLLKEKGIQEFEARLCNESASNTILANYQVGLYSNKSLLGIGWGESVDIAKNAAALDGIKRIYKFNEKLL